MKFIIEAEPQGYPNYGALLALGKNPLGVSYKSQRITNCRQSRDLTDCITYNSFTVVLAR